MAITQPNTLPITKRFLSVIKNGLLLFGIRNRLALIGLDIRPYYWVLEESTTCKEPLIKVNSEDFDVRYLTFEEIKQIASQVPNKLGTDLINGFKNGQQCIGLVHNKTIAAYTFIEFKNFDFNKRQFILKNNEAYLLNMWTFHNYRGKNLAPYLRYQCYRLLDIKGINTKYSITEYFNKSSIRFKKKLNAKHLKLYLSIVLFKKVYLNFKLKDYH